MTVFKEYSAYYDLLYKDKNYALEARYVHDVIQRFHPGAKTILSLGCGTGNYEFELAGHGYEILGIDISGEMIAIANGKLQPGASQGLSFEVADIRNFSEDRQFDVVISLFHVVSYLIENKDVLATFSTANKHLNKGGIFIFDYWFGPRVLMDGPSVRHKRLESKLLSIHRIANPVLDLTKNTVDINFSIVGTNKDSGKAFEFEEKHTIRFFFQPEIIEFGDRVGFSHQKSFSWMSLTADTGDNWYGFTVLKK